jgi:putative ABC transport system permease protein
MSDQHRRLTRAWRTWIGLLLRSFPAAFRRQRMGADLAAHYTAEPPSTAGRFIRRGATAARDLIPAGIGARLDMLRLTPDASSGSVARRVGADMRYGVRMLVRQPIFSSAIVLTLALGIGATTGIFSVISGVLLRPLPFEAPDRIVMIWQQRIDAADATVGQVSHPNYRDIRAQTGTLESVAIFRDTNLTVSEADGAELVPGADVSPDFFRVFKAEPRIGRAFTEHEARYRGPKAVIVSDGYWRERLGANPEVLGTMLRINDEAHEIVGVAPRGFDYPAGARIWVPGQNDDEGCGRGCQMRNVVARLADGASLDAARHQLASLATRLQEQYPESNTGKTLAAAPLRDVIVGDVRPALLILLGAVGMVLLIVCANVANLLLVRGRARAMEIALRATLGANRRHIISQLLTESVLLALAGGLAGVLLAAWGVSALRAVAPENIPRLDGVGLDPATLLFALALVLVTAVLFGLAPAVQLSGADLAGTLRSGGRGEVSGGCGGIGRSAILVAEVAFSVMLLLAAGLMVRSLVRMSQVDAGFETSGITQFRLSLPSARYADPSAKVLLMDRLRQRLIAIPGVEEVGVMVALPLSTVSIEGTFTRPDRPEPAPGDEPAAMYRIVDDRALGMLGVPIVAGRGFLTGDRHGAPPVALISERLAVQYFPGEDPIGREMQFRISAGFSEDEPRRIVGVFGDIRATRLTEAPRAEMLIPYAQSGAGFPHVLMRSRLDAASTIDAARRAVQALDPQLPLATPGLMDDLVTEQLAQPRFYLLILALFAMLAIVLAAVGIYGVVAYAVSQRTREIGVRMALGARVDQVVGLVLWQGLRPAALGVLLGTAGALAAGQVMRGLLYEVAPQDPVTFVAVLVFLVATVLVACTVPARRASRIPPATALHSE